MRAKRVRELTKGLEKSLRRKAKRGFYQARRASAGEAATVTKGLPPNGAMPPQNWFKSSPKTHLTRELAELFPEVTDRTRLLIHKFMVGQYGGTRENRVPLMGTGEVSKMSRPDVIKKIETFRKFVGVSQIARIA